MTAPARTKSGSRAGSTDRAKNATGTQQKKAAPERKGADKRATTPRGRSAAADRAYARRDDRRDRSLREPPARRTAAPAKRPSGAKQKTKLQERVSSARLPQVVVVMAVLAIGLAATLWLAIAAVSNSYQLQQGEQTINTLNERREELMRDVSTMNSTPALERRVTQELGMVPGPAPAHLVVQPGGEVEVVGEPEEAQAPAPPPAPPAENPAEPGGQHPQAGNAPGTADRPGTPGDDAGSPEHAGSSDDPARQASADRGQAAR
ncbi:hypothetical protein IQ251_07380 [Saccharopolyspora sp. HNM0983]|uniref:Cell division protein FtsL n=1 Tax=Saccharopolyspora montiporae TaxID=2781240 RepID=A0A929B6S7_9PSEU|nr:hypothetical protein [Saccharopolyspora sp. HNM0983]MBE9374267.1 hypothetical protein [Saccharopolyspora sp. HNM0983]